MTMKRQKTLHRFAAVAAVLLTFCLVFMMPVGAEGTIVNDAAALMSAFGTGGEITLGQNIDLADGQQLIVNIPVTLNLNGKTLTLNYNPSTDEQEEQYAIVVKSEFTINGGTVQINVPYGVGLSQSFTEEVVITDVTFNGGENNVYIFGVYGGKLTIESGTFTAPYCVVNVFVDESGSGVINGGVFTVNDNRAYGTSLSSPILGENIIINGGTFNQEGNTFCALGSYGDIDINGGTFNGMVLVNGGEGTTITGGKINGFWNNQGINTAIKGGTITVSDADALRDTINALVDDGDNDPKTRPVIQINGPIDVNEQLVINAPVKIVGVGNTKPTITCSAEKLFRVHADADFENLNLKNTASNGRCIDTRTDRIEVNINNCVLTANGGGNPQPLTIGDYKKEGLTVTLSGTTIDAGKSGYGITTFVPVTLIIKGESEITGYGALYFKDGSDSTSVTISESTITGNNKYSEEGGNSFGVFILEEKGITVTLEESANVALASAKGTAVESIFLFNTEWNADAQSGNTINVEANVHLATDGENTEFATNVYENTLNIQKCVTSNFQIESKYLDTTGEEKLASVATRINENGVVTEYTVQAVSEETVVPETPKVETLVTTDQNGAVTSTTISKPTGEETSIKKTGYDAVTITQTSNSGSGSSSESTETPVVTIVIKGITDSAFINSDDGTEFNSVTIPANAEITATYAPIEAASDGETEGTEKTQVSLSLKIDNISKPLPVIDASIREEVIEQVDEKSTAPVTILAMITAVGEDKNTNIKGSDEKAIAITFKVPASAVTDKNMLRAYHVVAGNPEALPNPIVSGPEEGFYTITIYGSSFSSYVLVEEEPQTTTGGGSGKDTGSGNYQYYPRSVPTDGIVDFGTSKVITGMELPAGSDGTVTLNIKPTFAMPENGFYAFEIDAPGYNTDAKINGGLSFQIPVADLEAAGWTAEDIVLFHGTVGEDGKIVWEALPTNLVKNENGVASYKAAINSCSPFYIGFVKDGSVVNTEVVDPVTPETPETPVTPDEPEVLPPVDEPETPEQPTESPAPILAVLAGLGAAVVLRRK